MLENWAKKSLYALMANAEFDRTTQTFDNFGNLTPIGKEQFWRHIDKQLNDYKTLGHEELMKPWIQRDSKLTPPNKGSGNRAADLHLNDQKHNNRPSGSRPAQKSDYSFHNYP